MLLPFEYEAVLDPRRIIAGCESSGLMASPSAMRASGRFVESDCTGAMLHEAATLIRGCRRGTIGLVDTPEYQSQLKEAVARAVDLGAADLRAISAMCSGADPSRVEKAMKELDLSPEVLHRKGTESVRNTALARRRTADFLSLLPDANPEFAQWWYSIDGVGRLADLVYLTSGCKSLLLIGASTVAPYYAVRFDARCHVLDIDPDVISALGALPGASNDVTAVIYDVATDPDVKTATATAAVVDPPWYEPMMGQFVGRAAQVLQRGGYVFCTIPGELTRPGVLEQRAALVEQAARFGLTLRNIHVKAIEYSVPLFEGVAFSALGHTQPWRFSDLAVFEKTSVGESPEGMQTTTLPESFKRSQQRFRLFLDPTRAQASAASLLTPIPEYSNTVSRRDVDRSKVALWTSSNVGFAVRDAATARKALKAWESTRTVKEALETLASDDSARLFLSLLRESVALPDDATAVRRTAKEIAKRRDAQLSEWAEREPIASETDGYRPLFARDRDRILWSNGLRQLANKTQVFATSEADYVRQRLTHSIEVMQLASTIGSSLGLDRDLVEAGALSHDIGHTPFGHAGEVALHRTLNAIAPGRLSFNHYEHGIDVVRWLEDAYRHPANGGKFGLELSPAVLECIFKHTFCYGSGDSNQKELYSASKHQDVLTAGPCHLEGQAVRAADKVSYLISDIEDGLRLGAIGIDDLRACRLFHHAPIDLFRSPGDDALGTFMAQRRSVISILMQDLIDETARRLASYGTKAGIRTRDGYTVDHSDSIRDEVAEVWTRIQAGKIHHDPRVIARNRRSARIVSRLLMLFSLRPGLVEREFRERHAPLRATTYMSWYRDRVKDQGFSIPSHAADELALHVTIGYDAAYKPSIDDVVQAKDYVASLTDQHAERVYHQLLGV